METALVWRGTMRLCLLISYLFLLSSCIGSRPEIPTIDVDGIPIVSPSASTPFEHIAYWASGLAGLAVVVGIVLLWVKPKLGKQLIVTALSVLIGAQIMIWIGAHLVFISIITLVLGLAYVSYKHRDDIIDIFDGDTEVIVRNNDHD